jgi:Carboxypeptidase regulatory-like domain
LRSWRTSFTLRLLALATAFVITAGVARAGTLHGTVKNGTTGQVAPGVEVVLIQLQGGMQPVANTKTDAQGQFSFDNPTLGTGPMLVRAVFHGVNFHQPATPGKTEMEIEVFDPTQDAKTISVPTHIVIFQPNGSRLVVGEEYSVLNNANPKQAYFRADGNFEFALPDGASLQQAAAWGPSGMPVVQSTIDKTKNRYAVAFAFRPGESGVRFSYEVPYTGNAATIKIPTVYPDAKLLVLGAPTLQIAGDGLEASGQEQGMNIYGRGPLQKGSIYSVSVSGTAPPPNARGGGDSDGGGQQGQDGGAASQVTVTQIPGRLDVLKWPLVVGFLGLFALGAIFLAREPVAVVAGVSGAEIPVTTRPAAKRAAASGTASKIAAASPTIDDVDAAVGSSLDSLKDQIFRLELRRQAGTISEEEYAQERARAEKVLRDLVRG